MQTHICSVAAVAPAVAPDPAPDAVPATSAPRGSKRAQTLDARRSAAYTKKVRAATLKVTKETLPTLTARDLKHLNSSGKLRGKVQLWLPREGGNRMRRANEAVAADMLSVWPEGQEVILIPGEGPARE